MALMVATQKAQSTFLPICVICQTLPATAFFTLSADTTSAYKKTNN